MALFLRASERLIFLDASAYIALYLRDDEHHSSAYRILERLTIERWHHYTTTVMVAEAHARIQSKMSSHPATSFVEGLYASEATTIERIGHDDERKARDILRKYDDKQFSYADALSFAVMHRVGIEWAVSFDDHFKAYGQFIVLDSPDAW